jgi:thioredoxin-like negative regulator of GroEL
VIAFVNGQPADGFMGALPESQVVAFLERLTKDSIGGEAKDLLKAPMRRWPMAMPPARPTSMRASRRG